MDQATATVIATLVGPIAAVGVTLAYQNFEQRYQRKLAVFRALMQWRANWLHPDWVGALNLIPVEFSGRKNILTDFSALIDKLSDSGFAAGGKDLEGAYSRAETTFIELMQKISKEVGIDIGSVDIRGRVYAPRGWATEQAALQSLRVEATALVSGNRPLKVEIISD